MQGMAQTGNSAETVPTRDTDPVHVAARHGYRLAIGRVRARVKPGLGHGGGKAVAKAAVAMR